MIEQFWGRAVRERPMTLTGVWGAFVCGAVLAVSPSAMEHVFPCETANNISAQIQVISQEIEVLLEGEPETS